MSSPSSAPVRAEDVLPVGSRVNWGSVFAGVAIALSLYFLLTLIGGAVGMSVSDRVQPTSVGVGAAVWAVLSTAAALFVGGWVTSQLSVGENKTEAAMHGVILWGVLFGMLLWLMASGVRAGFTAMVGMANVGAVAARGTTQEDFVAAARQAGVSQKTIDSWRDKAADAPDAAARAAQDPENQQAVAEAVTRVTWWAVLGTILSMAAAVGGSLAGSGTRFRLVAVADRPRIPAFDRHLPATPRV